MMLTHKEIRQIHERDVQSEEVNYEAMATDMQFEAGDQWDPADYNDRVANKRPIVTINQVGQFVRQVSGDLRQSEPSIKPVPVENTDAEMTSIYEGIIRQIEYLSGARAAYAWGGQCAIAYGLGHWRIVTDYSRDDTFDQDIRIKRIFNPLSVTWDSAATELDRSDASHCTLTSMISKDTFKAKFGRDVRSEYDVFESGLDRTYWMDGENKARIGEFFERREVESTIYLLDSGVILTKESLEAIQAPVNVIRERKVKRFEIWQYIIDGADILDEPKKWVGSHIPVVSVIGNEIPSGESVIRHGIIRFLKEPSRLYNYWRSVAMDVIGKQPRAPFVAPISAIEGLEKYYEAPDLSPVLPYNPNPDLPNGGRPSREMPPQPPAAMWQESQISQAEMNAAVGIYPSALGARSNETSGKAIAARQRESDTGTYIYFDNFAHAMRRSGTILVDLISKVYDGERIQRILGPDSREAFVPINQTVKDAFGNDRIVNDITTAKFDVRIDVGPTYTTAREASREQLGQLMQTNPQLFSIIGDKYIETLDIPEAGEIAERVKAAMGPQAGGQQQQPDPIAMAHQQLAMEGGKLDLASKAAAVEGKKLENARKAFELGRAVEGESHDHIPRHTVR